MASRALIAVRRPEWVASPAELTPAERLAVVDGGKLFALDTPQGLISGTAPPRAVLPAGLRDVGGQLPLAALTTAIQDPWFGFGWSWSSLAALAGYAALAGAPALWSFSRD